MTGPNLTAMLLFGGLTFLFGFLFTVVLNGVFTGLATGAIVTALTCAFIHFAPTGRHAFARGFLGLGAVFIIIPIAALTGLGEQVADGTLAVLQADGITEQEASALFLSSIFASAGLVFGMILVLIGGLMHRPNTSPEAP